MFTRIAYVIQFVQDIARVRPFYAEALGLRVVADYGDWVELDAGNTVLALHGGQSAPHPGIDRAAYSKPTFEVASIDAAAAHFRRHGIEPAYEPREVAPGRFEFSVLDPEGLPVGVYGPR